jgi:hypothetical protein
MSTILVIEDEAALSRAANLSQSPRLRGGCCERQGRMDAAGASTLIS